MATIGYSTSSEEHLPQDLVRFAARAGPATILADALLTMDMPIVARGGAIIPTCPPRRSVAETLAGELTLHAFPDWQSHADGSLYEDNGISMAYASRAFTRMHLAYDGTERRLGAQASGDGSFRRAAMRVRVHGGNERRETYLGGLDEQWETEI